MKRIVNGQLTLIRREEYEKSLPVIKHVFLVGDLHNPSPHPYLPDSRVEMVICQYEPGDDGLFHWHASVTEYEVIVEGEIGYRDAATGEITWLRKGDLIAVPTGYCVQRVVKTSAKTIALKVPSLAEKTHCDQCERECISRVAPYKEK